MERRDKLPSGLCWPDMQSTSHTESITHQHALTQVESAAPYHNQHDNMNNEQPLTHQEAIAITQRYIGLNDQWTMPVLQSLLPHENTETIRQLLSPSDCRTATEANPPCPFTAS